MKILTTLLIAGALCAATVPAYAQNGPAGTGSTRNSGSDDGGKKSGGGAPLASTKMHSSKMHSSKSCRMVLRHPGMYKMSTVRKCKHMM